jgi:hypothetical protein
VSIGTWLDIRSTYDFGDAEAPTIQMPTRSLEQMAADHPEWAEGECPLQRARLLFHVVVVDRSKFTRRIAHVEQFEIDWSEPSTVVRKINTPECRGTLRLQIHEVVADAREFWDAPKVSGRYDMEWRGLGGGYSSRGGSFHGGMEVESFTLRGRPFSWQGLLSVVPAAGSDVRSYVNIAVHLVDPDDQLRDAPATVLLPGEPAEDTSQPWPWYGLTPLNLNYGPGMPPAFSLIERMGLSFLLVMLAGLLLARLARRYLVGAMVAVPVMVLLVVAWDRAALATHRAVLADKSQPDHVRRLAMIKTAGTFFFKETAARRLTDFAEDPAASPRFARQAWAQARVLAASEVALPFGVRSYEDHTSISRFVPALNRRVNCRHALYRDDDGRPLMLYVKASDVVYSTGEDMAYVILAQEGTAHRIVTVNDKLEARVIGAEQDFLEAARTLQRHQWDDADDVWRRLILPALVAIEAEEPLDDN